MDEKRARDLLQAERIRVERLLSDVSIAANDDRSEANAGGDMTDPAERLTAEEGDDAVEVELRSRLAAVERAQRRIDEGTYGFSVQSGLPIPDARLEADPAAELTLEEAQRA
jgi:DnaK suppressor protein